MSIYSPLFYPYLSIQKKSQLNFSRNIQKVILTMIILQWSKKFCLNYCLYFYPCNTIFIKSKSIFIPVIYCTKLMARTSGLCSWTAVSIYLGMLISYFWTLNVIMVSRMPSLFTSSFNYFSVLTFARL